MYQNQYHRTYSDFQLITIEIKTYQQAEYMKTVKKTTKAISISSYIARTNGDDKLNHAVQLA
jgi:hypothetical protein